MCAIGWWLALNLLLRGPVTPVAVAYPAGTPEYERVAGPRLTSGAWQRFTGARALIPGQIVYTFGTRAAREVVAPGHEIVELFVAGRTPLVSGHRRVSWEAPAMAWEHLLSHFGAALAGLPVCVLTTPGLLGGGDPPAVPRGARVVSVRDAGEALAFSAALARGRHTCGGVLLAADFEVLDARVFDQLARLQTVAWIPLFGRTRHEVLLGAVAAVEPLVEDWDPAGGLSVSGQIFYNKHIAAWFGVGALPASGRWRTQALAR